LLDSCAQKRERRFKNCGFDGRNFAEIGVMGA